MTLRNWTLLNVLAFTEHFLHTIHSKAHIRHLYM